MRKTSYIALLCFVVLNLASCQKSDDAKPAANANTPTNETVNELATPQCRTVEKSKNTKTSLHYAVLKKDFTSLVSLINTHKIDINSVDENGFSAFDYAITSELEDHAQVLLENGANINGLEAQESFPLQIAITRKSEKMIRFLIEKKANLNQRDSNGRTALMSTAYISEEREFNLIFSSLLAAGAKAYLVDCKGYNIIFNNITSLHYQSKSAILNQYLELNKKEFLEIKDMPGILVMTALGLGYDNIMAESLIKVGAKANAPGTLVELLKTGRNGLDNIEDFIAAGADVNSKLRTNNMSALEYAISYYGLNSKVVSVLLKNGAKADATSKNINVRGDDSVQSVQKLKDLGYTVAYLKNSEGKEPLILEAAQSQNIPLINFLLDNGADPKVVNYKEKNSLDLLFSNPNGKSISFDDTKNVVSRMINLGLNVASDTKFYDTLTTSKYVDILKIVAENGAELNIIDKSYYENPLLHSLFSRGFQKRDLQNWSTNQLASLAEIKELLTIFASRGYDFNKQNKYGDSLESYIDTYYKNNPETKNSIIQHLKSLKPVKPKS